MTKLNMAAETTKPNTAPAPAGNVKHGEINAPAEPLATPAAAPVVQK